LEIVSLENDDFINEIYDKYGVKKEMFLDVRRNVVYVMKEKITLESNLEDLKRDLGFLELKNYSDCYINIDVIDRYVKDMIQLTEIEIKGKKGSAVEFSLEVEKKIEKKDLERETFLFLHHTCHKFR